MKRNFEFTVSVNQERHTRKRYASAGPILVSVCVRVLSTSHVTMYTMTFEQTDAEYRVAVKSDRSLRLFDISGIIAR